jgi:hypothetical protein
VDAALRFAVTVIATWLFVACGLLAVDASAHVQPTRIHCPVLVEGRSGEMFIETPSTRIAVGDSLSLVCVHTDGVTETRGPPRVIQHVPEPQGMLPVGLVALAFLARRK